MLARLTSVGAIAAVGQLFTFVVGVVLLREHEAALGLSYVQLTSMMQVTQLAAFSLFSADLMFLSTEAQRNAAELVAVRRVVVTVSGLAALVGSGLLLVSGSAFSIAISMAFIAAFAMTIEPVHYGAGRSVRAAWISFSKSALVPVVFLCAWSIGWSPEYVWIGVATGCVIVAIQAVMDARRYLPPIVLNWSFLAIVVRGGRSLLRGTGAAANGLQRLVPLVLLSQTSTALELQPLYIFYSAYNIIYGGFRVVSQVLVREHRLADAASRTNRLFGAMWCALTLMALAVAWVLESIPWVMPVLLAVLVTLPAAAFLGSHVRMTSLGRFGPYNFANVIGLIVVAAAVLLIPDGSSQIYMLAVVAVLVEFGCGLTYFLRDRH